MMLESLVRIFIAALACLAGSQGLDTKEKRKLLRSIYKDIYKCCPQRVFFKSVLLNTLLLSNYRDKQMTFKSIFCTNTWKSAF